MPLDRLVVSIALDGSQERFRSHADLCIIEARNDFETILAWVKSRHGLSPRQRGRRRHRSVGATAREDGGAGNAERFVLWASLHQRRGLSDMTLEDGTPYRDFLADPRPDEVGCEPRGARRGTPAWRTFEGSLSPAAQWQSVVILRGHFTNLNNVNYLAGNAWMGVQLPLTRAPHINAARSFTMRQWNHIEVCLDTLPPTNANQRLAFALRLHYGTGLRLSEAVQAKVNDLAWVEYPPDAQKILPKLTRLAPRTFARRARAG